MTTNAATDGPPPPRKQSDDGGRDSTPSAEEFAESVRPLIGPLVRSARRVLVDEATAWDAVQEALLGLWLRGEAPPNPRAWLIRAVVLKSLHQARSLRRRRRHEGQAAARRVEVSERDDPSRWLEVEDVSRRLGDALDALRPEQREVLLMKAVAQMDYAAMADALGVPVGTVRSRLNRARHALRDALGARDGLGADSGPTTEEPS